MVRTLIIVVLLVVGLLQAICCTAEPPRVERGLQSLYVFEETSGAIRDVSGVGQPLNLAIDKPGAVQREEGRLIVRSAVAITSQSAAEKILNACRQSGELTVEAWLKPADAKQDGPARIVSLSKDPTHRNFTLGQEGEQFDFRLRTTATSENGIPSTVTPEGAAKARLTHVVYTRDHGGNALLYVNGKQRGSRKIAGTLANWNKDFRLALANELTGDRSWRGELHLVAVFSAALTADEVKRNFEAGADSARSPEQLARRQRAAAARHFESDVARLLARRCLECHDSASKGGKLDLSRKAAALAGGEQGKPIVPGKPQDSILWELVESDEMPKDRPPLSVTEKAALRKWIETGAVWSLDFIDPAVYALDSKSTPRWVQRLTVAEYIESVRQAVGVDISKQARELLPPDRRADGFSNTAYNLNVDLGHVSAYAKLAGIIVGQLDVEAFTKRFSRSRRLTDAENRKLISGMGKWLLRGPLAEHEVAAYRGIATTVASAGGDFREAMSYVIEAMLQSPRFVYRVEHQQGGGTLRPVGQYELASRLSYMIWGGPPDAELLGAADDGKLDRTGTARQAERMLNDPRAQRKSLLFASEWLNLDRLNNLRPDLKHFPDWKPELAADMRAETLQYFEEVVWRRKRPLAELFNTQVTFVTPRLARHYGLLVEKDAKNHELQQHDLRDAPERGGLLTHGSILTVGGDEASMVTRGLFVLHDLLRGVVNDPPPCVNTTPVPTKPGLTQRSIAESRIANAQCGGCHGRFEPLAFGLEKFDGLGAFHNKDQHGNALRDDGEILFPGQAKPVDYQSSAQLMDLLAASDRVRETMTWKVSQFLLGRPLGAADARELVEVHRAAQENGGTYSGLVTAIVLSDLVQKTRSAE